MASSEARKLTNPATSLPLPVRPAGMLRTHSAIRSPGSIVKRGPLQAHYNTRKAGVIHPSRSLAMEWATRGVRVNAISPGYTLTPMNIRPEVAEQRKIFGDTTPLNRMAAVDEKVGPAVFLSSRAASFVTGLDLIADGGLSAGNWNKVAHSNVDRKDPRSAGKPAQYRGPLILRLRRRRKLTGSARAFSVGHCGSFARADTSRDRSYAVASQSFPAQRAIAHLSSGEMLAVTLRDGDPMVEHRIVVRQ